MHSCELVVPPPVQGAALLFELGTLIIEGRNSKPTSSAIGGAQGAKLSSKRSEFDVCGVERRETENYGTADVVRGALPKRPAANIVDVVHLSPAKRNRDQTKVDQPKGDLKFAMLKKMQQVFESEVGTMPSTSGVGESLSVYEMKARLANAGNVSQRERAPLRGRAEALWRDHIPLCIEVLLAPDCGMCRDPLLLLERWTMSVYSRKTRDFNHITSQWLLNAVRSQLHFSQISAWIAKLKEEELAKVQARVARELSPSERQRKLSRETCNFKKYESNCDHELLLRENLDKISGKDNASNPRKLNVVYILKLPEENKYATFQCKPLVHKFPITDIGNDIYLEVSLESLPRIEDIPLVHCKCSLNNNETRSRRKSKDATPESNFEDALAIKLAAACCLADKKPSQSPPNTENKESKSSAQSAAFVTDLGVINADKGSTSSLSRKLSVYSLSDLPEFGYRTLSSYGMSSEQSDSSDVLISNCKAEKTGSETDSDVDLGNVKNDDSYQSQYSGMSNNQVPLTKLINKEFILVDDRMQTPCRQSGKHRCNCDEESDQGVSKDAKNSQNVNGNSNSENCSNENFDSECDYLGTARNVSSIDKEITKRLRKPKKDLAAKHMNYAKECQRSTETHKAKRICNSGKKVRTCSSSDNSDGRSSPELVHYNSFYHICHSCFYRRQEPPKNFTTSSNFPDHTFKDIATASNNWLYTSNNEKHSELSSTTSIPILQASKFDHVNRFGNFRSTVSLHGSRTAREFYSLKQPNNSLSSNVDQKSLAKSSNQVHCLPCCEKKDGKLFKNGENQIDIHKCYYYSTCEPSKRLNSDDDYRPSTKKLISSATQTDDVLCECGNSLIPKCYECINIANFHVNDQNSDCNEEKMLIAKMKRSNANHDLSKILLEAIIRPSNSSKLENSKDDAVGVSNDSENKLATLCHDQDFNSQLRKESHGNKVIDFNCDNSVSNILNNCECDKNIVYSTSFNESSCTNNLLSNNISTLNDTDIYENDKLQPGKNKCNNTKTDLSILVENNSFIQRFVSKSPIKKVTHKEKPPDLNAKTEFIIKKPKFKRFAPAIDKINKIVIERNMQKENDKCAEHKDNNVSTNILCSNTSLNKNPNNDDDSNLIQSSNQFDDNKSNKVYKISLDDPTKENDDEKELIYYEKGDYGTFGKILTENDINIPSNSGELRKKLSKRRGVKRDLLSSSNCNSNDDGITSSDHSVVPSISEMDKFRWRLDSAASMVFHSRTGLPLTSSPAPLRRGKSCFDYDSSINSVSGIKSALYGLSSADLETPDPNLVWSPGSSPGSPSHNHSEVVFNYNVTPKVTAPPPLAMSRYNKFRHGTSSGLLGSFEESVLNGRLEPAATVPGFTAEIGASGEFCPSHITLPVTVFFYSLGDNTTSSPYLGHINLGRKGYCVPRAGTIQVTLFNPHGTVVKMFVVMYNLEDMPPYSRTFLRQRTLWGGTCLRYLIHLRFLTSKSGKVYLHTDIRIIVSRKADLDTAAAHSLSSALISNGNNDDKMDNANKNRRRQVETGTFRKRTVSEICDIERRKLNRSIGCYELSTHCPANGCNDALMKYRQDINQNRQSLPINSLNLPSVMTKELSYELRSFTYGPENPKYSPR